MFLTSAGQASQLPVLLCRRTNPIHFRVSSDRFVERIDTNHLEVFEARVLCHPIRAQHSQRFSHSSADPLFGDRLMVAARLQFIHAVVLRLTISGTFGHLLLTATASDADSVDNESLFGSISKTSGLLCAGRTGTPMDDIKLSVLPTPQPQQESHHIRLLVAPDLLDVLIGTHSVDVLCDCRSVSLIWDQLSGDLVKHTLC